MTGRMHFKILHTSVIHFSGCINLTYRGRFSLFLFECLELVFPKRWLSFLDDIKETCTFPSACTSPAFGCVLNNCTTGNSFLVLRLSRRVFLAKSFHLKKINPLLCNDVRFSLVCLLTMQRYNVKGDQRTMLLHWYQLCNVIILHHYFKIRIVFSPAANTQPFDPLVITGSSSLAMVYVKHLKIWLVSLHTHVLYCVW